MEETFKIIYLSSVIDLLIITFLVYKLILYIGKIKQLKKDKEDLLNLCKIQLESKYIQINENLDFQLSVRKASNTNSNEFEDLIKSYKERLKRQKLIDLMYLNKYKEEK